MHEDVPEELRKYEVNDVEAAAKENEGSGGKERS